MCAVHLTKQNLSHIFSSLSVTKHQSQIKLTRNIEPNMQILHWLSKLSQEHPRVANPSPITKKHVDKDCEVKSKDIGLIRQSRLKGVEQSKLSCGNSYIFKFIRIKDLSKTYFYQTLNLRTLGRSFDSMKMKKEDISTTNTTTTNNVSSKVLPITESSQSSANTSNEQCSKVDKKEKTKGEKSKTLSKMKELLRWAAAAKGDRGGKFIGRKVLLFKNRAALKAVPDSGQMNDDESPKISFRWDVESCSTISSSVYSALKRDQACSTNSTPLHVRDQWVARSGSWVTTDSEFVVLEL